MRTRMARRVLLALGFALVAVFAVAVRLPFASVPLTADEGGYAYVAYFWGQGDTLYRDLWVDRPQLLLLVYRAVQETLGMTGENLRVGGALYNLGSLAVLATIAWRLFGPRWALLAALFFAWFSAAPHIEGFTTNGELLTTLPTSMSVLLVLVWASRAGRGRAAWGALAAAGMCAGASFLLKQSGIDAGATMLFTAIALVIAREVRWSRALAALAVFGAGALAPMGMSVAHGLSTAADAYTFAIFTYRVKVDSLLTDQFGPRVDLFMDTLPMALLELGPLLVLVPFGVRALWRQSPASRTIVLWLVAAFAALAYGGQFHAHYYVALVPSLVVVAVAGARALAQGFAVQGEGLRDWRRADAWAWTNRLACGVACVWVVAAAVGTVQLMRDDDKRAVSWTIFHEERYLVDQDVGNYLREHTGPNDRVYAMYAAADMYYYARRRSSYPYLWFRGVARIPGAVYDLQVTLRDPDERPRLVAVVQEPSEIDSRGYLGQTLHANYRRIAMIGDVEIYEARDDGADDDLLAPGPGGTIADSDSRPVSTRAALRSTGAPTPRDRRVRGQVVR